MSSNDFRYPRTYHIDGSGLGGSTSSRERLAWADLRDRNVVLEEKMDGSETSFEFNDDLEPILRYRGFPLDLSSRGGAEKQFDRFKDWFELHADSFFDCAETRYRVYGEWLFAAHRVFYDALPCHFLEFDVLDLREGRFLDTPRRRELFGQVSAIHSVSVIAEGPAGSLDHPSRLAGPSAFKSATWRESAAIAASRAGQSPEAFMDRIDPSDLAEGIYGKVEENGEVKLRFKWIRPDFVSSIVKGGRHWKDMPLVANVVSEEYGDGLRSALDHITGFNITENSSRGGPLRPPKVTIGHHRLPPMQNTSHSDYDVEYLTPEGEIDMITVEAEDENDATEAARGELTDEYPSVATDEWEIRSVRLATVAPSQASPLRR